MLDFKIVKYYEALKQIRLESGFTSTSLRLTIRVKKMKKEKYDIILETEEELAELDDLCEIENLRAERVYKKLHRDWEIRKEKLDIKFTPLNEPESQSLDELNLESEGLNRSQNIPHQPIHKTSSDQYPYDIEPLPPSQKKIPRSIKDEIKKRLRAAIRPLNSPILAFSYENDIQITKTEDCPTNEQNRRRQLQSLRYQLILNYNDKKVTCTNPKHLEEYQITFNAVNDLQLNTFITKPSEYMKESGSFAINVDEPPETISVQVLEEVMFLFFKSIGSFRITNSCEIIRAYSIGLRLF